MSAGVVVSTWGDSVYLGGSAEGGVLQKPPVNRITDACENITCPIVLIIHCNAGSVNYVRTVITHDTIFFCSGNWTPVDFVFFSISILIM